MSTFNHDNQQQHQQQQQQNYTSHDDKEGQLVSLASDDTSQGRQHLGQVDEQKQIGLPSSGEAGDFDANQPSKSSPDGETDSTGKLTGTVCAADTSSGSHLVALDMNNKQPVDDQTSIVDKKLQLL